MSCCSDHLIEIYVPEEQRSIVDLRSLATLMTAERPQVGVWGCTECKTVFLFREGEYLPGRKEGYKSGFYWNLDGDLDTCTPVNKRLVEALGGPPEVIIYADGEDL